MQDDLVSLVAGLWQSIQSHGAYLIQQGQGMERTAVMIAKELERLGLDPTAMLLDAAPENTNTTQ